MAWAARYKAPPVLAGSFLVEMHDVSALLVALLGPP